MKPCDRDKEKTYECDQNPQYDADTICPWRRDNFVDYPICTNPYIERGLEVKNVPDKS